MTLTARHKDSGEILRLESVDNFDLIPGVRGDYLCPITGTPVVPVREHIRQDSIVRAHWRVNKKGGVHWPDDVIFDDEYGLERNGKIFVRESDEHLEGKRIVLETFSRYNPECTADLGEPEKRIYIDSVGKYRIADIAFVMPYGGITVCEVQISPITPLQLEERTIDYLSSGVINVYWFFGSRNAVRDDLPLVHYSLTGHPPFIFDYDS